MRVAPSSEQRDYLESVGISSKNTEPRGEIYRQVKADNDPHRHRTAGGFEIEEWVRILLLILLCFFAQYQVARGEEMATKQAREMKVTESSASDENRFSGATEKTFEIIDLRTINITNELIAEKAQSPIENQLSGQSLLRNTAESNHSKDDLTDGLNLNPALTDPPIRHRIAADAEGYENHVVFALTLLLAANLLVSGLMMTKIIRTRLKIGGLENLLKARLEENPKPVTTCEKPPCGEQSLAPDETLVEKPASVHVLGAQGQEISVGQTLNQIPSFEEGPSSLHGPWTLGLATNKGNVRMDNQDYGLCFRNGAHTFLIIADGCGGIPHGAEASFLSAASAAAYSLNIRQESWNKSFQANNIAEGALLSAAQKLQELSALMNFPDIRAALRTTLIVVVADQTQIGYSYIGDGGACVVRSTGLIENFLKPQRDYEQGTNVICASLGPRMDGAPVTGLLERKPGDLVIVGTDGVFDRVNDGFPKDVLRACFEFEGDLQTTAEHILDELASFRDDLGYVCDDNLTLGLIGDGMSPRVSSGFWTNTVGPEKVVNSDVLLKVAESQLQESVT